MLETMNSGPNTFWLLILPCLAAAVVLALFIGRWRVSAAEPDERSLDELRAWLRAGAGVVDVRSPEEYRQDHVAGATNLPLDQLSERVREVFPDKDQPLLLYCRSGRRSALAQRQLSRMGYTRLWNLGGLDRARRLLESAADSPPQTNGPSASPAGR